MDSIINIRVGDGTISELTVRERYQWDNGVKLQISGVKPDESVTVQYANDYMSETLNPGCIVSENGITISEIPNTLFMLPYNISCYINVNGTDSSITIMRVIIPIIKRAKPSGYVYTPEEISSYEALMRRLNSTIQEVDTLKSGLDELEENANQAASNADTAAKNAVKAANAAQKAADNLNGISFELNLSDGCLYLITPGIIQGYAFTFDPSDGCLYMEKSI